MRRILLSAPITLDLLEFEREVFIDEILKRTQLLFGSADAALTRYGIVDDTNPTSAVTADSRPFSVAVNTVDTATVDVQPGTAVFSSGEIIVLENGGSRLEVPGGIGTKSVVYLQFSELEQDSRLTRYETLANTFIDFLASDADYIQITTRNDYDALTFAERALTIPLAQIVVQEVTASGGVGTTSALVIDMSASALTTNRPWFTPVDLEHRSYIGSGSVSTTNPHGMSLNDVSATATTTLFHLNLDHGMIVSKDKDLSKVPGKICEETILAGAITVDTTGSVTGIIGAFWFRTSNFPTQVLRATDPQLLLDYAPVRLDRSNLMFILPNDEYPGDQDVVVYYMTTDAAEPPTEVPLTSLTFKTPANRETVLSDGRTVSTISNLEFTFEDAGPIPQDYIVYLDSDGVFHRYPQTVFCYKLLSTIGFTLQVYDQVLDGPARLKIGLQNAIAGATLDVQFQVTGTDSAGATITETVVFDSTWVNNAVRTCEESLDMFKFTSNTFTSITNFIMTTNTDSGPNAAISIYADVRPISTEELADVLPVCEITWNGLEVCKLEDIRPINTILELPKITKHAAGALALSESTLTFRPGFAFNFWVEDFDKPKFISTQWSDDRTSPALSPTSTDMRKVFQGLDRYDTYVGKPMAVKPHDSAARAIRFIPIEPDRQFAMYARYFDGTGVWSDWVSLAGFVLPAYTIDLGGATTPLVKWQVQVSGQCQGLITVYVTDGPGLTASAFVYDVGVWDDGTFT